MVYEDDTRLELLQDSYRMGYSMLAIPRSQICYRKCQSIEDSAADARGSGAGTTNTDERNTVAEARQPTGKIAIPY